MSPKGEVMRRYLIAANQTLGGDQLDGGVIPGAYKIARTLPRRLSRCMAMDLPHRIRRATKLPVTHISGPAGPSL
jgi:hypothetical protein